MTSIAEKSKSYEAGKMANITELDRVSTSIEVSQKTFKQGTADEFTVDYICIDGTDYRIPNSVFANLKDVLAAKPDLKNFRVVSSGNGMSKRYTVVPLD